MMPKREAKGDRLALAYVLFVGRRTDVLVNGLVRNLLDRFRIAPQRGPTVRYGGRHAAHRKLPARRRAGRRRSPPRISGSEQRGAWGRSAKAPPAGERRGEAPAALTSDPGGRAGLIIASVSVVQIAGDEDERDVLLDRCVDQIGECGSGDRLDSGGGRGLPPGPPTPLSGLSR
jgi:hypothetical protein